MCLFPAPKKSEGRGLKRFRKTECLAHINFEQSLPKRAIWVGKGSSQFWPNRTGHYLAPSQTTCTFDVGMSSELLCGCDGLHGISLRSGATHTCRHRWYWAVCPYFGCVTVMCAWSSWFSDGEVHTLRDAQITSVWSWRRTFKSSGGIDLHFENQSWRNWHKFEFTTTSLIIT